MQVMSHQRDCLALSLYAAPGHQLSQRFSGSGYARSLISSSSRLFRFAAVFAERSF
jgi:hypothetical protein